MAQGAREGTKDVIRVADSMLTGRLHPSPNHEPRRRGKAPDMVVLHYTGMTSAERAIAWLADTRSKVSCHYVVDEVGRITQMVAEAERAWHAGVSWWAGESDINSVSIGIEIHNPGHELGYPPFTDGQMEAVTALTRDICARHRVPAERVLAHSDVAPGRKIDPGERFDWHRLWRDGVGHWVEPTPIEPGEHGTPECGIDSEVRRQLVRLLGSYGYNVGASEGAPGLPAVVRAFQQHFRPARADGLVDGSTIDTLERLVASRPTTGPAAVMV